MEGYIQCLIDRYKKIADESTNPGTKIMYTTVANDLIGLQAYQTKKVVNGNRKQVVISFNGKSSELTEYLKEAMKTLDNQGGQKW